MIRGGGARSWVVTGGDADAVACAASTLRGELRATDSAAAFIVESCSPDARVIVETFDRIGPGLCVLARAADPMDALDGDGRHASVGTLTDALVPLWRGAPLEAVLRRLVVLATGSAVVTPTREEYGMAVAAAAAARSKHPERRVGAALTDAEGEIVACGVNDAPRCGGGFPWYGDADEIAVRSSGAARARVITHLEERLDGLTGTSIEARTLLEDAISPGMVDYGNAVHAETAALLDAARRGVQVAGTDLHTTRYPCHACVRHLLHAGVRSVTWLWPMAHEDVRALHPATTCWPGELVAQTRLELRPFSGIAPGRYLTAHSAGSPL